MGARTGDPDRRFGAAAFVCDGAAFTEVDPAFVVAFPAWAGMEFLFCGWLDFAGGSAFARGAFAHAGLQRFVDRAGFGGGLVGERFYLRRDELYRHRADGRGFIVDPARAGAGLDAE